ncbi:hypothetical protein OH77DRAFT_1569944 [Trametes cingulata]|nr:hypothetical protein OH77DRAFT_1569944 [Trametes cingulata]
MGAKVACYACDPGPGLRTAEPICERTGLAPKASSGQAGAKGSAPRLPRAAKVRRCAKLRERLRRSAKICEAQRRKREELRIVKEKLACARCSIVNGGQAWCYVDRTVSEHVPLQPEHLTLWARCMHDGLCDRNCHNPPNCLALDKLRGDAKRATRMAEQRRKKGNGVGLPEIHVHVGSPLRGRSPNRRRSSKHKRRSRRKHSSSPPPTSDLSSSSSESMASSDHEEGEALPVSDVLSALNATQPAACYPSFEGALAAKGIIYAHSALYFDTDWYVREVHMPEGLVRPFLHQVKVMLKKRRRSGEMGRAEKRMRADENIDPTLH